MATTNGYAQILSSLASIEQCMQMDGALTDEVGILLSAIRLNLQAAREPGDYYTSIVRAAFCLGKLAHAADVLAGDAPRKPLPAAVRGGARHYREAARELCTTLESYV